MNQLPLLVLRDWFITLLCHFLSSCQPLLLAAEHSDLYVSLHLVCLSVLRDPAVTCLFDTFLPMLFSDIFQVSAQFVLSFAA